MLAIKWPQTFMSQVRDIMRDTDTRDKQLDAIARLIDWDGPMVTRLRDDLIKAMAIDARRLYNRRRKEAKRKDDGKVDPKLKKTRRSSSKLSAPFGGLTHTMTWLGDRSYLETKLVHRTTGGVLEQVKVVEAEKNVKFGPETLVRNMIDQESTEAIVTEGAAALTYEATKEAADDAMKAEPVKKKAA